MEQLTVKEVSELLNCSQRTIQKQIKENKIEAVEVMGEGKRAGKIEYRVLLSSLDATVQKKYYAKQKKREAAEKKTDEAKKDKVKAIEELSKAEREQIAYRQGIVEEAINFRNAGDKKTEQDEIFVESWNEKHPEEQLSVRTLRKWISDYKKHGAIALLDQRGKGNKGRTVIDEALWSVFADYYLDQSQKSISFCYKLTATWAELENPHLLPVPSRSTFERKAKQLPKAVTLYFRHGEKAFEDKAMPYIIRMYDDLESNDIWVADNHTFDVMTRYNDIEKVHRIYVTTYLDVKARKFVGWYVTNTPSSDANLFALKKGIEKYGIPKVIYCDNGREFLVRDIGGRGVRKSSKDQPAAATILDRLGIKMVNAKVRNAKAKIVERAYKQVKEEFSRCFDSYTGGNILERPERLKEVIKDPSKLLKDGEFSEFFDTYIDGWYNKQPHHGEGMNGKCPDEVYAENLFTKRVASKEDLNLMMLRWANIQTVSRIGVKIKLYGQQLVYWNETLILNYLGKKVFIRYNPEDLKAVRVYDEEDRFIMDVESASDTILTYGADKEDVKKASSKINRVGKQVKKFKEINDIGVYENTDALDVVLRKAKKNLEESDIEFDAKVIEPVRLIEKSVHDHLEKAAGDDFEGIIDMKRMIENAKKNK